MPTCSPTCPATSPSTRPAAGPGRRWPTAARAPRSLLAAVPGAEPCDEAGSRPWAELAARFPDHPIPFGCHSTTLEFRGEREVSHELARADAAAIGGFLTLRAAGAGAR